MDNENEKPVVVNGMYQFGPGDLRIAGRTDFENLLDKTVWLICISPGGEPIVEIGADGILRFKVDARDQNAAKFVEAMERLSGRKITGVDVVASEPAISSDGRYWYDPSRGKAWPWDGNWGCEDKLMQLVDVERFMPILDILPRLWAKGWKTVEQDGEWWLFGEDGEDIDRGRTFRELCVNIVLAGY